MKYKITYFDRDTSSIGSKSSMTRAQRRKMLKDIFHEDDSSSMVEKEDMHQFEELGVEVMVRTPELEENTAIHQIWKNFDQVTHKRRRTYRKDI